MTKRPAHSPAHSAPSGADDTDPHQQPGSLADCRRCDLWRNATQPVPGAGGAPARLMLVGEQPGDKEDQAGLPFVGPAGQLLDAVLEAAGIGREMVYVTNAVKHFKWELRGKRRLHKTPAQREVEACAYWLERELAHVKPKVVVALGATALRAVLHDPHARLNAHMERTTHAGGLAVLATWHPSYVLRAPDPDARERARAQMVEVLRRAHALMSGH
ncbi:UdgX family uracil-DNA binding protein [Paraburkholderia tagetis]|uniref:Type-4 uracil-DNA glycosylase n=1 Tax=Paraburkholderia tagetis TaxID=2913261 RepID=A0A9X1RQV7_9BURK|nr:UdgX family uracil-DNA binding protein [Paraburkholderia tagetis]MCG5075125.1 UdgX family uracil-DNA binding protein [Paraburkholderia tagetis]